MNYYPLITCEILLTIVVPLLILYRRGTWSQRSTAPCLVAIPVLWYPVYSPLHELSHVAATYLVGGNVTYIKLIPSFWLGEFGRAWIKTEGVTQQWQQLLTTAAPYLFDLACLVAAIVLLKRTFSRNPFLVGFLFMLLCLRSAFDFVCESVGLLSGDHGDLFAIQSIIGAGLTWSFIVVSLGLSLFSIATILRRYSGFPGTPAVA
jgi:hypothetical protein